MFLRVLGNATKLCDGLSRRELIRVGGLSLFGGMGLSSLLRAEERQAAAPKADARKAPAKSVILINLFGGPPHQDMFDLKPQAPDNIRGEFKPISTSLPGVQICELLPEIAKLMDRGSLIRTYSHRYNSHNPYVVMTGFDGGVDAENYFAKPSDHPSIGSVCQHFGVGSKEALRYVIMPAFPGYSQALRRAGPYGGYLGSSYDPLFTQCTPKFEKESKGDYDPNFPQGEPILPAMEELQGVTADRLNRRRTLLQQLDDRIAQADAGRGVKAMNHFQEQIFSILTSSKTRGAFDLSREKETLRERYGRNLWGSSALIARRLVQAGSTFVTVNWESKNSGHWDLHENNFNMLRTHLPILDRFVSALVVDLEQQGLLDSTLVVVMGEMGRTPRVNGKAGRDHWPQCGFSLLFGGGTKKGFLLGKTDREAAYPIERPVSSGDMVATIYQLLGVDPNLLVHDLSGRPVPISHGGSPVFEIIA